jgi:hypothetical protein
MSRNPQRGVSHAGVVAGAGVKRAYVHGKSERTA